MLFSSSTDDDVGPVEARAKRRLSYLVGDGGDASWEARLHFPPRGDVVPVELEACSVAGNVADDGV